MKTIFLRHKSSSMFIAAAGGVAALLLLFVCPAADAQPAAGDTADPMIKIATLPIKQDKQEVLRKISAEVSKASGVAEQSVAYYWQTLDALYCPGCAANGIKDPVFVDMYTPAFMTAQQRAAIMESLAESIARHTDYSKKDVYIHNHIANKDQVFIMGSVVTNWKQVGGPDG